MKRIDELDLPYLAMEDPGFAPNPWPHLAAARKQHPWLARSAFGYEEPAQGRPSNWRPFFGVRGLAELPIAFDPAASNEDRRVEA